METESNITMNDIFQIQLISSGDYNLTVMNLIVALFIILSAIIVLSFIKRIFKRQKNLKKIEIGRAHAILQLLKYIVWVITIILVIDALKIEVTLLLASSAALLVGLGLGLQQIFQDFVSGITLLIEGTLKVGDIIQTQDGEVGKVKEIGMRTSKLETRDNIILIVPNSKLINDNVINWSHLETNTRFGIKVGVAYGSDIDKVTEILLQCARNHNEIVNEPEPFVFFRDFGSSSLDFELMFYTTNTFRVEKIKSDLRYKIDRAFRDSNITIPFPQRDVHVINPK